MFKHFLSLSPSGWITKYTITLGSKLIENYFWFKNVNVDFWISRTSKWKMLKDQWTQQFWENDMKKKHWHKLPPIKKITHQNFVDSVLTEFGKILLFGSKFGFIISEISETIWKFINFRDNLIIFKNDEKILNFEKLNLFI